MDAQFIILHHSATLRDKTTFEAINEAHRKRWNFKSQLGKYAGYHRVITADGVIHQSRRDFEVGAHCIVGGMNLKSLGVCLTGNFEKEKPTEMQLKSLEVLLDIWRKIYKIPKENILGHKQIKFTNTLCPGKNLLSWLENYKNK